MRFTRPLRNDEVSLSFTDLSASLVNILPFRSPLSLGFPRFSLPPAANAPASRETSSRASPTSSFRARLSRQLVADYFTPFRSQIL